MILYTHTQTVHTHADYSAEVYTLYFMCNIHAGIYRNMLFNLQVFMLDIVTIVP